MGITYIVITESEVAEEEIKKLWNPLQLKYKDKPNIEFLFTNDPKNVRPKYKNTFTTPWFMVPSYAATIAIETGKYRTASELPGPFTVMYDMKALKSAPLNMDSHQLR